MSGEVKSTTTQEGGVGGSGFLKKPTQIVHERLRFLIHDAPTDLNVQSYIEHLKKRNVTALVRACQASYSKKPLTEAGIKVYDLPFADGDPPPHNVVENWLQLIDAEFGAQNKEEKCISVHCVAGLGRAPVLVALALVEYGMTPHGAIEKIRKKRRGALNNKQLKWIQEHEPQRSSGCCAIL